jgi:hypothetical protein
MGRENREVWAKRVERWRESGLTAKEFAAEVGVKASTLHDWSWRLSAGERTGEPEKVEREQFIEVATPAKEPERASSTRRQPMEKIELVLASGVTVRLPARFEAEALRRLLAVVG